MVPNHQAGYTFSTLRMEVRDIESEVLRSIPLLTQKYRRWLVDAIAQRIKAPCKQLPIQHHDGYYSRQYYLAGSKVYPQFPHPTLQNVNMCKQQIFGINGKSRQDDILYYFDP